MTPDLTWMTDSPSVAITALLLAFLAIVLAVAAIGWALRRITIETLFLPVLGVALFVTTDGMYRLATGPMERQGLEATIPAIFYEVITLYLGAKAKRRKALLGSVGHYGTAVIVLGILAGFVAAGGGGNLPTMFFRLAAPPVTVAVWWLVVHEGGPVQTVTAWLWSPRRLAIWLRIIAPGEHDDISIDRNRRVRALTRVGNRAITRKGRLGRYYDGRLRALARASTWDMIEEAAEQVRYGREARQLMIGDAVDEAAVDAQPQPPAGAGPDAPREATHDAPADAGVRTPAEVASEAVSRALTSENAVRLTRLRERVPGISQGQAIKRLELSRSTVQRLWKDTAPVGIGEAPVRPVNGHAVMPASDAPMTPPKEPS